MVREDRAGVPPAVRGKFFPRADGVFQREQGIPADWGAKEEPEPFFSCTARRAGMRGPEFQMAECGPGRADERVLEPVGECPCHLIQRAGVFGNMPSPEVRTPVELSSGAAEEGCRMLDIMRAPRNRFVASQVGGAIFPDAMAALPTNCRHPVFCGEVCRRRAARRRFLLLWQVRHWPLRFTFFHQDAFPRFDFGKCASHPNGNDTL